MVVVDVVDHVVIAASTDAEKAGIRRAAWALAASTRSSVEAVRRGVDLDVVVVHRQLLLRGREMVVGTRLMCKLLRPRRRADGMALKMLVPESGSGHRGHAAGSFSAHMA